MQPCSKIDVDVHLILFRLKERQAILSEDPHYTTSVDAEDHRYSLYIADTLPEDAGWYMCLAHNDAGTAFSEAQLLVESKLTYHPSW